MERDPATRAVLLARLKARDVALKQPDHWVLGCDTLVASADQSDPGLWHFTIRLQGHDETVFFDL